MIELILTLFTTFFIVYKLEKNFRDYFDGHDDTLNEYTSVYVAMSLVVITVILGSFIFLFKSIKRDFSSDDHTLMTKLMLEAFLFVATQVLIFVVIRSVSNVLDRSVSRAVDAELTRAR